MLKPDLELAFSLLQVGSSPFNLLEKMGPKKAGPATDKKLQQIYQPSEKEIADARAVLKGLSDKEKRSRTGSFTWWAKENGLDDAAKSRKDSGREEYLAYYIAYQQQKKGVKKTTSTAHDESKTEVKACRKHWWSKKKMDDELGEQKAEAWRVSLKDAGHWRADPVTGNVEDDFAEWHCPEEWDDYLEEESKKKSKVQVDEGIDQEDEVKLQDIKKGGER